MVELNNMFFEVRFAKQFGDSLSISSKSEIISEKNCYAEKYLKNVLGKLTDNGNTFKIVLKNEIGENVKSTVGDVFCENDESYAIEIGESEIILSAPCERGLNFAVSTLWQLQRHKA